MEKEIVDYFRDVKDQRVVDRCDHLLSDFLVIAVCTYLSGGSDYQDMYLFGKERGNQLKGIIFLLPNGHPSADTYERVFKNLDSSCLKECLEEYGKDILGCLAEKQVVLDGKKLKGSSPHEQRQLRLVYPQCMGQRELYLCWPAEGRGQIQ